MKNAYRKLMEQQSLSENAAHNFYTALHQHNSSNKYTSKLITITAYIALIVVIITFVVILLSSLPFTEILRW